MDSERVVKRGTVYVSKHYLATKNHTDDSWDVYEMAGAINPITPANQCMIWSNMREDEVTDIMHVMEEARDNGA